MNFHIARAASTTGRLLQTLVAEEMTQQGVRDVDAHICYGVGHIGDRTLNGACSSMNKLQQATVLYSVLGTRGLPVFSYDSLRNNWTPGILLARKMQHTQGKDIKLILEPWQLEAAHAGGSDFFTPYIPSRREFRVWSYRNRHLGTYEKILRRPGDWKRIGRNYKNGFDFSGLDNDAVPQALKDTSRDALRGLGLDFGAVDIIEDMNGNYVVLEVNSAPGVSGERRKVIRGLAHRIVRWVANGCPARRE
jgi:hypothetical protein